MKQIEFTVKGSPPVKYVMGPRRQRLMPKVKEAKENLAATARGSGSLQRITFRVPETINDQ